jgi:hypothetical protein
LEGNRDQQELERQSRPTFSPCLRFGNGVASLPSAGFWSQSVAEGLLRRFRAQILKAIGFSNNQKCLRMKFYFARGGRAKPPLATNAKRAVWHCEA